MFFFLGVKNEKAPVKKIRYFAILPVKKKKAPVKNSEIWQKSGREKHFLPVKILTNTTREKKTPCPWKIYTIFPAKMKTKCDFYLFLTREIDFSTREKNGKKGQN